MVFKSTYRRIEHCRSIISTLLSSLVVIDLRLPQGLPSVDSRMCDLLLLHSLCLLFYLFEIMFQTMRMYIFERAYTWIYICSRINPTSSSALSKICSFPNLLVHPILAPCSLTNPHLPQSALQPHPSRTPTLPPSYPAYNRPRARWKCPR